jgi:hypothetical protein
MIRDRTMGTTAVGPVLKTVDRRESPGIGQNRRRESGKSREGEACGDGHSLISLGRASVEGRPNSSRLWMNNSVGLAARKRPVLDVTIRHTIEPLV